MRDGLLLRLLESSPRTPLLSARASNLPVTRNRVFRVRTARELELAVAIANRKGGHGLSVSDVTPWVAKS